MPGPRVSADVRRGSIYARRKSYAPRLAPRMTGGRVGVGHDPSRGAAYVEAWVAAFEEDPREIRRATQPGYLPHAGWPSPRIRREQGQLIIE